MDLDNSKTVVKKNSQSPCIDINGSSVNGKNIVANHFGQFYCQIGLSVQGNARYVRENVLSEEFKDSRRDSAEFQFENCANDEMIKIVKKKICWCRWRESQNF